MPGEIVPLREPSLSSIPASTLMIVMVGEEDVLVGDLRAPTDLHTSDGHPSLAEAIRSFSVGSTWSPAPDRGTHGAQRHALPSR